MSNIGQKYSVLTPEQRELRALYTRSVFLQSLVKKIVAYTCHKTDCRILLAGPHDPCTCGLDELRKNPLLK